MPEIEQPKKISAFKAILLYLSNCAKAVGLYLYSFYSGVSTGSYFYLNIEAINLFHRKSIKIGK